MDLYAVPIGRLALLSLLLSTGSSRLILPNVRVRYPPLCEQNDFRIALRIISYGLAAVHNLHSNEASVTASGDIHTDIWRYKESVYSSAVDTRCVPLLYACRYQWRYYNRFLVGSTFNSTNTIALRKRIPRSTTTRCGRSLQIIKRTYTYRLSDAGIYITVGSRQIGTTSWDTTYRTPLLARWLHALFCITMNLGEEEKQ